MNHWPARKYLIEVINKSGVQKIAIILEAKDRQDALKHFWTVNEKRQQRARAMIIAGGRLNCKMCREDIRYE